MEYINDDISKIISLINDKRISDKYKAEIENITNEVRELKKNLIKYSDELEEKRIANKKYWAAKKANRKTLFYLDDNTKPIRAAGVIIYKIVDGIVNLLLINVNNRYEDLGGKIEHVDIEISDTVIREALEESNNL